MNQYEISLTKSTRKVLKFLLEETENSGLEQIVQGAGISKRSVYYDLNHIRHLLKALDAGSLDREDGTYLLTSRQRQVLKEYLRTEGRSFEKSDRIAYIICAAICSSREVRLETLISDFGVSRNAVLYDLAEAKRILSDYQLSLVNTKKRGYYVSGDVFRQRSVFLLYVTELLDLLNPSDGGNSRLTLFDAETVDSYLHILHQIVEELHLTLEKGSMLELVYLILVVRNTPAVYKIQLLDIEYVRGTKEFHLVDRFFQEIKMHEKLYLAICLLGYGNNRLYMHENPKEELKLQDCANKLVEAFERIACVDFERRDELIASLYLHMKLSYFNYCYLVPNNNPLFKEIQEDYGELYRMTKASCEVLKEELPYLLDENEVSYLTIHFGVYMHKAKKEASRARVLITCLNITTSSLLLKSEIEQQFDNIEIVDMVRPQDITRYTAGKQIDFIISTVPFDCSLPMILVHPILTQEDKANIVSLMMLLNISSKSDNQQVKALLKIVRNHVDEETYQMICHDLNSYLNSGGALVTIPEQKYMTLYDILAKCGIMIEPHTYGNWEKAVREAALPLLDQECIREEYIDAMISMAHDNGPWFVINDEMAIAHAHAENGVDALGLTLTIFQEGLNIMGKSSIHFLFVLATPNNQEHLHILQDIMELSGNISMQKELLAAQCEEDALLALNKLTDK